MTPYEVQYHDYDEETKKRIESVIINCGYKLEKIQKGVFHYSGGSDGWISVEGSDDAKALYLLFDAGAERVLAQVTSICQKCGSSKIREARHYSPNLDREKYDVLPGAFDRFGVTCPNWRCTECGQRWFNSRSMGM